MHSDVTPARSPFEAPLPPLGTALRRRRPVVAAFVTGTVISALAALAVLDTVDLAAWIAATGGVEHVGTLSTLRLTIEVGVLGGLAASAFVVVCLLTRDDRVRPGPAVVPLSIAVGGFVVGALLAVGVLPALFGLRTAATGVPLASAVDPTGVAELVCFFPVSVGIGVALPAMLVAGVRAGAVSRYVSTRQRGLVALLVVTLAATHSPADLPTFALVAAPPLAGFGVGLAWLEFR